MNKIKDKNQILLYNIYLILKYDHKKRNQKIVARFLSHEWSYEQYLRSVFILVTFLTGILQLYRVKQKDFATNSHQVQTSQIGEESTNMISTTNTFTNELKTEGRNLEADNEQRNLAEEISSSGGNNPHQRKAFGFSGNVEIESEATHLNRASGEKKLSTGAPNKERSQTSLSEQNQMAVGEDTGDRGPQQREVEATKENPEDFLDFSAPNKENPEGFLELHSANWQSSETNTSSEAAELCSNQNVIYPKDPHDTDTSRTRTHTVGEGVPTKENPKLVEGLTAGKENFAFSRYAVIEQQSGALYLITKPLQFYSNLLPIWMIAELFIHLNSRKQSSYVIRRVNCWNNDKRIQDVIGIAQIQSHINAIINSLQNQRGQKFNSIRRKFLAYLLFIHRSVSSLPKGFYRLLSERAAALIYPGILHPTDIYGRKSPSSSNQQNQFSFATKNLRLPRLRLSMNLNPLKEDNVTATLNDSNEAAQNYLFVGPSGTGKTLLAKAIAGSAKVNLFCTTLSEIQSSSLTSGSAHLRKLFQQARVYSPSLIILENLELIGQVRKQTTTYLDLQLFTELLVALTPSSANSYNSKAMANSNTKESGSNKFQTEVTPSTQSQQQYLLSQVRRKVVLPIQQFFWDLKPKSYSGIRVEPNILIGTTHDLKILDPAFIRPGRFNRIVYFTYPNKKDRIRLLKAFTKKSDNGRISNSLNLDQGKNDLSDLFHLDLGNTKNFFVRTSWSTTVRADSSLQNRIPSSEFYSNSLLSPPEASNNNKNQEKTLAVEGGNSSTLLTQPNKGEKPSQKGSEFHKSKSESYKTVSTSVKDTELQKANSNFELSWHRNLYYFAKQTQGLTHADLHTIVNESKRQLITKFVLSNRDLQWLFIPLSFSKGRQSGLWQYITNLQFTTFYRQKLKNTFNHDMKQGSRDRLGGYIRGEGDQMADSKTKAKNTVDKYQSELSRFSLMPEFFLRSSLKRNLHKIAKHNKMILSAIAFCFIGFFVLSKSIKSGYIMGRYRISFLIGRLNKQEEAVTETYQNISTADIQKQSQTKNEDITTETICIDPWKHSFLTLRKALNRLPQKSDN
jgi:hypothetical protein